MTPFLVVSVASGLICLHLVARFDALLEFNFLWVDFFLQAASLCLLFSSTHRENRVRFLTNTLMMTYNLL